MSILGYILQQRIQLWIKDYTELEIMERIENEQDGKLRFMLRNLYYKERTNNEN